MEVFVSNYDETPWSLSACRWKPGAWQDLLVDPCDSKAFTDPFQFLLREFFCLIVVTCNNDVESSAAVSRGSFSSTAASHR